MSKINSTGVQLDRLEVNVIAEREIPGEGLGRLLVNREVVNVVDWCTEKEWDLPEAERAEIWSAGEDAAYAEALRIANTMAQAPINDDYKVEIRAIRKDGRWWSPNVWNPAPKHL